MFKLSKNQIIILSTVLVIIAAWFIFFRKPKVVAAPAPKPDAKKPAESNYGYSRTNAQEMATAENKMGPNYPY